MEEQVIIARVLRSNTGRFTAGTRLNQLKAPYFGALVKAVSHYNQDEITYGIIYDIQVEDDPLVRQMILANSINEEILKDQREHRMAPVELHILTTGYLSEDFTIKQTTPPRPPMGLDPVYLCEVNETSTFSQDLTFLQLLYSAGKDFPIEQLLAATISHFKSILPRDEQYDYLIRAGREVAKLWGRDFLFIQNLIRLLKTN